MTTTVFRGGERLRGKTIFLSASKPTREPELFPLVGSVVLDLERAVVALARAVFAEKGRLVFGAHPSITPLIVDVATEYFAPGWDSENADQPVVIYQSKAFQDVIPEATRRLATVGYARIEMTDAQEGEKFDPTASPREQCLQSLAHMRQRMFSETQPTAMIAAGGMQGVVREARLFLDMFPENNVFMLRTTGGASGRLIQYLQNNPFQEPPPNDGSDWISRVIGLEDRYGEVDWERLRRTSLPIFSREAAQDIYGSSLPRQPYSLIMERLIAGFPSLQEGKSK